MKPSPTIALDPAGRLHHYAQVAAVAIVVIGCFMVLRPFVAALLFAAVVCSATWPVYVRLRTLLWNRPSLAALTMTFLLAVLVVGPSVLLAASLSDNVAGMADMLRARLEGSPMPPPAWLRDVPLAGGALADYWGTAAQSAESLTHELRALLEPARHLLLAAGKAVGQGLLQLVLATFIGFFFYRDGEALVAGARGILARLAGPRAGDDLASTISNTVTGVVHGIFGTALAQALVAMLGFFIAGVPGAFLLGVATFFLSVIPVGPPLVWGPAAIWLFTQGQTGWAIFMLLWGLLAISSIDNVVKPYLISRSSRLPLLLIVLGVFGGVVAFGFIGIFIGPPVLAVGATLLNWWTVNPQAGA